MADMKPTITVWVTKYALRSGIGKIEAEIFGLSTDTVRDVDNRLLLFRGEGREWHRTAEGAKSRAEEMRVAKIASLNRQIAKLEKMTFDDVKD